MKVALVGLMQSGKSTLFSAISGKEAMLSGVARVEEAVVAVPDERLTWLTELYNPKRTVLGTVDSSDVPGFNFTDSATRTLARQLVNQVRSVDMFVLVLRAFENPAVPAYKERVDPIADLKELWEEFVLADLELVSTRIEKLEKQVTKVTKTQEQDKEELALQLKLQDVLEAGRAVGTALKTEKEVELVRSRGFLTLKPIMAVVNVGENDLEKEYDFSSVLGEELSISAISVCASLEQELSQLDAESKAEFMDDLGLKESAAAKFVNACYTAMGLISFLTVGDDEVRAWPIKKGISALDAAGKVHSDIQRGFIRAETMAYEELKELGNEKAMRAAGKIRLEGKSYIVQDGDIINFKFNV